MKPVEYRLLLPSESRTYREIRLESLQKSPDTFSVNYEESLKTPKLLFETAIESNTPERFVCGAFSAEELTGICGFAKNTNGLICQMYVKEHLRGQQIGKHLVENVIQEARKRFPAIDLFLEVSRYNAAALALYQKLGFKVVSQSQNDPIVVMKYR